MDSPLTNISPSPTFSEEPKKKRSNLISKIGKCFLAIVFLLSIVSFAIAHFFEDELKAKLVESINGQLKTELQIESFTLSLLKGFPNVSASFSNVVLDGTFQNGQSPLLEASSLSFSVPLLQLLSKKVKVKSVLIKDGSVSIYVNSKGAPNYKIIKSSNDSNESNDFQLNIERAVLENMEIVYTNNSSDITSKMRIDNANLSGNFSAEKYALKSIGNAESHFLDVADKRFVPGNQFDFDFILDIDMNENLYSFDKGNLIIDGNKFNIIGDIVNDPNGFIYDLKAKSKEGNLATVFTLLPEEYLEYFNDIKSTGTFLFDFTYKGQKTNKENPKLSARVRLKDGEIQSKQLGKPIKDVSFTANFNNGKYKNLKSSSIKVSDFKGYFNKELTEMELIIYNLNDPSIDLELDGIIPVNSIYKFFKKDMLSDAEGKLAIKDLKVEGKQNDMRSMSKIANVKVSGEIEFNNAGLSVNSVPFIAEKGALLLKGNSIQVKNLLINGADSDATISGRFKNLIPVMFADSTNSQNAELRFDSELISDRMDIDKLIDAFTSPESTDDEGEDTGWHSKISGFLDGTFDAYIKELNYNKLEGQEFEGSLDFEEDILTIDGNVNAMKGSMALEGKVYLKKEPKLVGEIEAKNIDVYKFFNQSNNFGQTTILDKNLKGRMNANMIINAFFDEKGALLTDKLHVYAGMEIHDGELVDLEMLEQFSAYIKIKDLQRIKFNNLENWFEISKGKVYIPVMFLQSNAVNLTVSGTHTFDHDINYNIKINAGQVLFNKLKKHDRTLKAQKDQRNGLLNLYYTVVGTVDNYKVSPNRKAVLKNFKTSQYRKNKIRRSLEESFGKFDLRSSTIAERTKEVKAKPKLVKEKPTPKKEETIQAKLDDDAIPEFDVEEENVEYIEFQGDDGD